MVSLWNDTEASGLTTDLALRVYTSQLFGRDPSLVLHGGGNTSVKLKEKNVLGEEEEVLYVKGSGWDLATIEAAGFAPVRLRYVRKLTALEKLSDAQMMNELATQMTRAGAPMPSVETILHALLPHKYVDHTHADAIVAVTNTADGEARIREIYGKDVVVIPYIMPGFDLARLCARKFPAEADNHTIGMVLMNHGIFSFGETAEQSYERMIGLVDRAEKYLAKLGAWSVEHAAAVPSGTFRRHDVAALRQEISAYAGFPVLVATHSEPKYMEFASREDVVRLSQSGPATPDHVIRTKRVPMLGRDVGAFADTYREYFQRNAAVAKDEKTMLDPAPRVALDRELGLCCVGRSAKDVKIAFDIYNHTIDLILRAKALGGYRALSESDIFDVEYWDLEQAKLRKGGLPPIFSGEVALVTGAASGIGRACVDAFLRRGAAVVGLDVNPRIVGAIDRPDFLGLRCDVTSSEYVAAAIDAGVRAFGGLDMLVLNAGMFPGGRRIEASSLEQWRQVMAVNLDANLLIMRECHPLLRLAPKNGRVVAIGSRNVLAPGPGAAAYSASKAGLTQLARVAALEWGQDGIRVNTLHPDAVFDTGLWTDKVLEERAKQYGISVSEYRIRNVLKAEVKSRDVAELAAEMCGPLFGKTTGAQIPVDGGNDRVI